MVLTTDQKVGSSSLSGRVDSHVSESSPMPRSWAFCILPSSRASTSYWSANTRPRTQDHQASSLRRRFRAPAPPQIQPLTGEPNNDQTDRSFRSTPRSRLLDASRARRSAKPAALCSSPSRGYHPSRGRQCSRRWKCTAAAAPLQSRDHPRCKNAPRDVRRP
jgi:hypothetical protein